MSTPTSYQDWLAHYELPDCIEAVEDYERYVEELSFLQSLAEVGIIDLDVSLPVGYIRIGHQGDPS